MKDSSDPGTYDLEPQSPKPQEKRNLLIKKTFNQNHLQKNRSLFGVNYLRNIAPWKRRHRFSFS